VSQLSLQQSLSKVQSSPVRFPDGPPQRLSQVPHEPLQHWVSLVQESPSGEPEGPPHVLLQVPHVPLQQSELVRQPAPDAAQPHVPPVQVPPQQSLSSVHVAPFCAPMAPPQVLSHVPHSSAPQQSVLVAQVLPEFEHGLPHMPPLHTRSPQQSALLVQVSPVPRQPHVPALLQTLGEQQSVLLVHAAPEPEHPHVWVPVSQRSAPQQSPLLAHPWPLDAHPQVPSAHTPVQHSEAVVQRVPSGLHIPASAVGS